MRAYSKMSNSHRSGPYARRAAWTRTWEQYCTSYIPLHRALDYPSLLPSRKTRARKSFDVRLNYLDMIHGLPESNVAIYLYIRFLYCYQGRNLISKWYVCTVAHRAMKHIIPLYGTHVWLISRFVSCNTLLRCSRVDAAIMHVQICLGYLTGVVLRIGRLRTLRFIYMITYDYRYCRRWTIDDFSADSWYV